MSAFGLPAFGLSAFGLPALGLSAFGLPVFGLSALGLPAFGLPALGLPAFGLSVPADRAVGAAAVGGLQVDDIAQQQLALDQGVVPFDDGAHGERALADAADHHLAAGLDALGDRNLALTRQQLHAAHFAQVHAHGIVGAAEIAVIQISPGGSFGLGGFGRGRRILAVFVLDDVDAHFREHGHGVLDLLGRHLVGRQGGVQVVIGDVAALLAGRDHLLDRRAKRIQEGAVGTLVLAVSGFCRGRRFGCHEIVASGE